MPAGRMEMLSGHQKNIVAILALALVVLKAQAGEIHDAVQAGDLAKIKALMAKDPKVVNEKDTRGRTIDLPAPRAAKTLKAIEVFTVNDEHNEVPEVAYLVKADGLAIYHSGDYVGSIVGLPELTNALAVFIHTGREKSGGERDEG